MMVAKSRNFVAWRMTRQRNRHDAPFVNKRLNRAVDRGNSQPAHMNLGTFMDFLRTHRTIHGPDKLPDRFSLSRTTFHPEGCIYTETPAFSISGYHPTRVQD